MTLFCAISPNSVTSGAHSVEDVVVEKFTFAILSPDEFLVNFCACRPMNRPYTLMQCTFLHRPSVYHVYHNIIVSDISLKTGCFGLNFCRGKFRCI